MLLILESRPGGAGHPAVAQRMRLSFGVATQTSGLRRRSVIGSATIVIVRVRCPVRGVLQDPADREVERPWIEGELLTLRDAEVVETPVEEQTGTGQLGGRFWHFQTSTRFS